MSTNIFAYTAPGANYPEFLSINLVEGGSVELTVRSPAKDGVCGNAATVTLSPKEFYQLASRLYGFACCNNA